MLECLSNIVKLFGMSGSLHDDGVDLVDECVDRLDIFFRDLMRLLTWNAVLPRHSEVFETHTELRALRMEGVYAPGLSGQRLVNERPELLLQTNFVSELFSLKLVGVL